MNALAVLDLVDAVARRDSIAVVRAAFHLASDVSIDVLRGELDAYAVRRANAIADAIEKERGLK